MFAFVKQLMEREAAIKASHIVKTIENRRRINIIYYVAFILAGIVGFTFMVVGFLLAETKGTISDIIIWVSVVLGFITILGINLSRDDYNRLNRISIKLNKLTHKLNSILFRDFLAIPFWVSIILLWIPLSFMLFLMLKKSSSWITVESQMFLQIKDSIKSIITFVGALLGVQLTLFTFVTGNLIGRYSGNLAKIVITHRAYLSLIVFLLIEMVILGISLIFGLPDSFVYLPNILGALTVLCMILSIWVTIEGIVSEKGIVYTGFKLAKVIDRGMKKPLAKDESKPSIFWGILGSLGLDWRQSDRLAYLYPSQRWCDRTMQYLNTLFNATNRAIREGEQEIFRASLIAILQVMVAYTKKRSFYYGSEDDIFSFLNNQMAAVVQSTSKISNEYLITDAIRFSGDFGKLSLDIGVEQKAEIGGKKQEEMPRGHAMALYWIGLLKEGFTLSHKLMRCTGASEAQEQLLGIATKALKKGYDEVVKFDYLPAIGEIHILCLQNYDAYHKDLSSNCYKHLLLLLLLSLIDTDAKRKHFYIEEEVLEKIKAMVKSQHVIRDMPSLGGFNDIINVLVTKISAERATLQDIVFYLNRLEWGDEWKLRNCAEEINRIINLVKDIVVDAIKTNQVMTEGYIEALYEISYILLCGETTIPYEYRKDCEKEVFIAWREILQLCQDDSKLNIFGWEHPMFGIIGYSMLIYESRNGEEKDELKEELINCVNLYTDSTLSTGGKKRTRDSAWDYLQLLGAWVNFFIKDIGLKEKVLKGVGHGRPFVFSYSLVSSGSAGGEYGYMEYPTIHNQDFFMPWLRNIQRYLNEEELNKFKNMQTRLISDEVLIPFYQEVEKIRSPLREKFYKDIREKRSKIEEG